VRTRRRKAEIWLQHCAKRICLSALGARLTKLTLGRAQQSSARRAATRLRASVFRAQQVKLVERRFYGCTGGHGWLLVLLPKLFYL
jgi:hypothetical protein